MGRSSLRWWGFVTSLTVLMTPALAAPDGEDSFFFRKSEGWFWYQDPPEPVPEPEPPQPPAAIAAPAPLAPPPSPAPFSTAWLRVQLPVLKDRAIDDPTPDNVAAYLYAQKVMFDKSDQFSRVWERVAQSDPLLDERVRFPAASALRAALLQGRDKAREDSLRYLAGISGMVFFFRSDCQFCHLQWPILQRFATRHGWQVRAVSLDGQTIPGIETFEADAGQARALGIQVVPAVALAVPPEHWLVVARGYLAETELTQRILLAVDDQGLLPEELKQLTDPFAKGLLTAQDLQGLPIGLGDDPKDWVSWLRGQMEAKYAP